MTKTFDDSVRYRECNLNVVGVKMKIIRNRVFNECTSEISEAGRLFLSIQLNLVNLKKKTLNVKHSLFELSFSSWSKSHPMEIYVIVGLKTTSHGVQISEG